MIYFEKHNKEDELIYSIEKIESLLSDTNFEDVKQYLRWVFHISGSRFSDDEIQKLKDISEGKDMLETLGDRLHEKGRKEGFNKGLQQGEQKGQKESLKTVVRSMKKLDLDTQIIAQSTGLSEKEIEEIAAQES